MDVRLCSWCAPSPPYFCVLVVIINITIIVAQALLLVLPLLLLDFVPLLAQRARLVLARPLLLARFTGIGYRHSRNHATIVSSRRLFRAIAHANLSMPFKSAELPRGWAHLPD